MASSYSQLSRGSKGSEVKTLQELLNQNGYSLDVDGSFGSKTQAAVKDYQKKNGLAVDGIVGTNTWGSLTSASTGGSGSSAGAAAKTSAADMKFSYDDYAKSDVVKEAEALLSNYTANKPGDFSYSNQDQLSAIMDQYLNRDKFSYDLNGDALYQQYAQQYAQQGKMAMMDTMGQAAAMTGGYGNSYAQTAGQQTYQGYLQQLNDVVPELYQMALNQYNQEGEAMLNQYGLLSSERDQEYGVYRDQVSDYYTELQRLTENARYLSEDEYNKWLDNINLKYGMFSDEKSYAYQTERDAVADKQWSKEFAESQRQYDEQMALAKEQWLWEKAQAEAAANGSDDSGGSGNDNFSDETAQIQQELVDAGYDIDVDGIWGPETEAAYQDYYNGNGGTDNNGTTGSNGATGVSDSIKNKLASLKSNSAIETYLESLEASGVINHETALQLMSEYMDVNESYTTNDDGSKSASYSNMVKSTSGWEVVDKGGINWFWGVDNDAIVEAPNGERIRLDNLVDKLVSEGMSKSDAKSYVKKLQKNLDIA